MQAWRNSVSNAQAQFEHQHNRLMNLDLTEKHGAEVWLRHNQALEQQESLVARECAQVGAQIQQVNHRRRDAQERVRGELSRLARRRDEAVMKSWQIEAHCLQMEELLRQHNIDIPTVTADDDDEDGDEEAELDGLEQEIDDSVDPADRSERKRMRTE